MLFGTGRTVIRPISAKPGGFFGRTAFPGRHVSPSTAWKGRPTSKLYHKLISPFGGFPRADHIRGIGFQPVAIQ